MTTGRTGPAARGRTDGASVRLMLVALTAEGTRQSLILQAEGDAQALVAVRQGQAQDRLRCRPRGMGPAPRSRWAKLSPQHESTSRG